MYFSHVSTPLSLQMTPSPFSMSILYFSLILPLVRRSCPHALLPFKYTPPLPLYLFPSSPPPLLPTPHPSSFPHLASPLYRLLGFLLNTNHANSAKNANKKARPIMTPSVLPFLYRPFGNLQISSCYYLGGWCCLLGDRGLRGGSWWWCWT